MNPISRTPRARTVAALRPGRCAALLTASGWAAIALAQPVLPPSLDPAAVQQQSIETQRRLINEQRERRGPQADPVDRGGIGQPAPAGAAPPARVRVQAIQFSPSEILSAGDLRAIARDYEGREVGFAELQALVARVNALYREKGAIAAEAVIPAQDVSAGNVQIRLVEGRVGRYSLRGNATTRESAVTSRLTTAPGELFNVATLERDLIWFNRSTDAQLRASLKPGQAFGTTDVDLELVEPDRNAFRLFADNAGVYGTGERRLGAVYQNRSLLGWRDDLVASATHSEGALGLGLAYGVPVNRWGGRFTLGFNRDTTRVKFGPFAPLNINGAARSWTATLRQPVYAGLGAAAAVSLSLAKRRSETYIDTVFLQKVDTTDATLGFDGSRADDTGNWVANASLVGGRATNPATTHYTVLRGTLARDQQLADRLSARATLSFQHSLQERLPSSAQFFLGGAGTVRGYSTSQYGGVRGHVVNLELRRVLGGAEPGAASSAAAFLFADAGRVRAFGPGLGPTSLASAGVGLDAVIDRRITLRTTWGEQLHRLPTDRGHSRLDVSVVVEL